MHSDQGIRIDGFKEEVNISVWKFKEALLFVFLSLSLLCCLPSWTTILYGKSEHSNNQENNGIESVEVHWVNMNEVRKINQEHSEESREHGTE
jgi:hypothetical protein